MLNIKEILKEIISIHATYLVMDACTKPYCKTKETIKQLVKFANERAFLC